MTTMNGVFARRLKSSRHRTAIRTGRSASTRCAPSPRRARLAHSAAAGGRTRALRSARATPRRFVGIYSGTVVRREQTLSAEHANQQYLFDLNEHVTIDGSRGGNVTRCM